MIISIKNIDTTYPKGAPPNSLDKVLPIQKKNKLKSMQYLRFLQPISH